MLGNRQVLDVTPGDTIGLIISKLTADYYNATVTFSAKKGSWGQNLSGVVNSLPVFSNTGTLSQILPNDFTEGKHTITLTPSQTAALVLNSEYAFELEFTLSSGIKESWQAIIKTGQDLVQGITPGVPAVSNMRFLGSFGSAPIGAQTGDFYRNTGSGAYYIYNGTEWNSLAGSGSGDLNYTQTFTSQTTLTINHGLNKYPAVTVLDTANDEIEASITHNSINQLTIIFSTPTSGMVNIN